MARGVSFAEPSHILLGSTDTEIVPELGTDEVSRVWLYLVNNSGSPQTFRIHRYKSGAAESANADNAYFYDRTIGPNGEEVIEISFTLFEGWKVSGQADGSNMVVQVDRQDF